MTRVCLVGTEDVTLQYELLSRETARDALATYDLQEPFENSVAVETVSLGAAVSLLNDLNWYLVRFTETTLVLDPSISDQEWLSRRLANAIRDDEVAPDETDRFLKVYGIESGTTGDSENEEDDERRDNGRRDDARQDDVRQDNDTYGSPPRLVEPMLVTRTGGSIPDYDLRTVEDTLVVRVTQEEFGA